ncbi:hypothetical protein FH972_010642 [Carpinus fangiana]|uniref:Uncharacterized protein n=1 Tax=Carpinus fangiana TaxID=176857 RepID=A0A660KQY4_9ROSI|nr:hypothetical protein FH972_010642 [Carpinus fangiana]
MAFPDHVAPFPEAVELIYTHPTAVIQSSAELIGHGRTLPPKKLRMIRCCSVQWPANPQPKHQWPANPQPNYWRWLAASHGAGEHPTTLANHCDPRLGLRPDPPTLSDHFSAKTPICQTKKRKPELQIPSSTINNPIKIFVSISAINNPSEKHNRKTQPAVSSSSPAKPNRKT